MFAYVSFASLQERDAVVAEGPVSIPGVSSARVDDPRYGKDLYKVEPLKAPEPTVTNRVQIHGQNHELVKCRRSLDLIRALYRAHYYQDLLDKGTDPAEVLQLAKEYESRNLFDKI